MASSRPALSLSKRMYISLYLLFNSDIVVSLILYPSPCIAKAGIPVLAHKQRASFSEEQMTTLSSYSGILVHKLITLLSCLLAHLKPFLLNGWYIFKVTLSSLCST